jgi:hypothetical protein
MAGNRAEMEPPPLTAPHQRPAGRRGCPMVKLAGRLSRGPCLGRGGGVPISWMRPSTISRTMAMTRAVTDVGELQNMKTTAIAGPWIRHAAAPGSTLTPGLPR